MGAEAAQVGGVQEFFKCEVRRLGLEVGVTLMFCIRP